MKRRIFPFALCATLCSIAVTPALAQQAWQPVQANVASPVLQAQALVPVPPVLRTAQVIPAQQLQPAPVFPQQPPIVTGPAFPPPSAGYDMYAQPGLGTAPAYAAPSYGPTLSTILPPSAPGCDPACGLPGVIAFAEFFDWDAYYPDTPFALQIVPVPGGDPNLNPLSANYTSSTGFRIGGGWRFVDGWDVIFTYTDFSTTGRRRVGDPAVPANDLIMLDVHPLLIDDALTGGFDEIPLSNALVLTADAAQEDLSLNLQVYDFEAGRKFCICQTLILRPFAGVRFAELDHSRRTQFYEAIGPASYGTLRTTRIDAAGLLGGARLSWNLGGSGFQLFARGTGSLLHADFRQTRTDVFANDLTPFAAPDATTTSTRNFQQIVPVAELVAGVRFEWSGFFISGGYEVQNWFNVVEDFRHHAHADAVVAAVEYSGISMDRGDIGTSGYFVRGGFNY